MKQRGVVAGVVLLAWVGGLAAYGRREYSRTPRERLAEAAMRIAPGATYYVVELAGAHVGFASSTVDTVANGIQVTDYLVADVPAPGTPRRVSAQSNVRLTRALALLDFSVTHNLGDSVVSVTGRTSGDTLLVYVVTTGGRAGDTTVVRVDGPVLLPSLVPLVVALGQPLSAGRSYTVATFDPATMSDRPLTVRVGRDSTFVVADSAAYDRERARWMRAHSDSVQAWRLTTDSAGGGFDGWVDDLGRMVQVHTPAGFVLKRSAYEIAFENWRASSGGKRCRAAEPRSPASRLEPPLLRCGPAALSRLPSRASRLAL